MRVLVVSDVRLGVCLVSFIGGHDPVSGGTSRAGHERAGVDNGGRAGVVCAGGYGGDDVVAVGNEEDACDGCV